MSVASLRAAADLINATLHGQDAAFNGVSTDTRALLKGSLYVALRGPNFDGHAFLAEAKEKGAAGAMVEAVDDLPLPQIQVSDTRQALGEFGARWRQQFALDVVGVTGSNGKTTVKQMLAAIFAECGPALHTEGNLNNDIGVPLTLLRLKEQHRAAVIEMGANGPAEIGELAALARPTVGVVTNAMAAHLEGFGSLEQIARTKGEMFSALPEDGTAVINRDDAYFGFWCGLAAPRRLITFGQHADADVTLSDLTQLLDREGPSLRFTVHANGESCAVNLPMVGRHNARNALAAIAAALACGISLKDCASGLAKTEMATGRLQIVDTPLDARVINDAYNANPDSMRAAIQLLTELDEPGWLVMGDMGEIGADERKQHADIGRFASACGVQALLATGPLSRAAVAAFGKGSDWYETPEALAAALASRDPSGVNVLVKASRSMRLERVIDALRASDREAS
ncbi:MAG: UDP-N-acetylmuramoyl-tripeptide--D-alanyl-D-alanine ligase [Pseudomonadota bacterium]